MHYSVRRVHCDMGCVPEMQQRCSRRKIPPKSETDTKPMPCWRTGALQHRDWRKQPRSAIARRSKRQVAWAEGRCRECREKPTSVMTNVLTSAPVTPPG